MEVEPTPRMATSIVRRGYPGAGGYAQVTLEWRGRTYMTTARYDIEASDAEVENMKRRFANLPPLPEGDA